MSSTIQETNHNPYAPYSSEEEWWKAEEARIQKEKYKSFEALIELKNGGKDKILHDIVEKKVERGDESVVEYFDLFSGSQRVDPKNPHPLTPEEYADLEKGILKDFGPPKFS
jgi:hypothetical protein